MKNMRFLGTGSVVGQDIIKNKDLESMIGDKFDPTRTPLSFCDWVEQLTGIKERRWTREETTEDMMTEASRLALENAELTINDIDLILAVSETGDSIIPDPSIEIAYRLGKPDVPGFTFDAACAGSLYGLYLAYPFISREIHKKILLVAGETLHKRLNRDPTTFILLGDAAGAVVLGADTEKGISSMPYIGADYSRSITLSENLPNDPRTILEGKDSGYIIMASGRNVFKNATNNMYKASMEAIRRSDFELAEIQNRGFLNIHQANLRIIEKTAEYIGIPMDRTLVTIVHEGNPSAPSNLRSLDVNVRNGRIQRGDIVLMSAIGGGYKFGSAVMEY